MPASPIRKLVPLAEAARARGTKIYHLNIGQPDLPSPQTGLDALKKIDRTVLEYSPSDGYRSLREKLVGYYEQFQIKLSPDDIIVTTGGSEAVLFAFMSCLNPGDEIIVPEPAYANYMAFAISAGAVIRPVVSSIEQGFALPDVAEFEKLINDRTRGILICNPNNPTGYLYTRKEMNRIRDLVKNTTCSSSPTRSTANSSTPGRPTYRPAISKASSKRGADRLGVEALLGVRNPYRGAHHQEPDAA